MVRELIRLCPHAISARDRGGNFPIHLAASAASGLTQGCYGALYWRTPPARSVVENAAACVSLLLQAWPEGATGCDDFKKSPRRGGSLHWAGAGARMGERLCS